MKNLIFTFLLVLGSTISFANDLSYSHGKLQYKSQSGEHILIPDKALKKIFQNNPDLYVLPVNLEKISSILVLVRYASKPQNLGRCGSGNEDYLFLLAVSRSTIKFEDKLLLQSCEKNVYLNVLDPYTIETIFDAIHFNKDELSMHFTVKKYLGSDALLEEKNYHIFENKFISMDANKKLKHNEKNH
jgi:hypothetical protein